MIRNIFSCAQKCKFKGIVGRFRQIKHFSNFKGLPKMEKTVKLDEKSKTFSVFNIFQDTYLSKPAFSLAKELFDYLLQDSYLEEEFPIIKQNSEIHINIMILHVMLVIYRINQEKSSYATKEATIFKYYCKSNFFVEFANKLNDHLPVEDFANDFIENYSKRIELFYPNLESILNDLSHRKKDSVHEQTERMLLKGFFRKNIFLFEVSEKDEYLEKLYKYFVAHRNYIMSLNYHDLTTNKIYWGLSKDTFLLEHFVYQNEETQSNPGS